MEIMIGDEMYDYEIKISTQKVYDTLRNKFGKDISIQIMDSLENQPVEYQKLIILIRENRLDDLNKD